MMQDPADEEKQQLKCPRCESSNTRFAYYNNKKPSQPRHFCKDCCRYWTKGGAVRDVPECGGTRGKAKRFATFSANPNNPKRLSTSVSPIAAFLQAAKTEPLTFASTPAIDPGSPDPDPEDCLKYLNLQGH